MIQATSQSTTKLVRKLNLFDATMIVMGGIIGSGIFMNPSVVAKEVHAPWAILAVWAGGGLIALVGAFVYAELAALRPHVGGQYAYMREAFHPAVAFVYGWSLLLVIQTGGMAAVAITFAKYFIELTKLPIADWALAVIALSLLTFVNCLGVRAGSTLQNVLMLLKILAIAALVTFGFLAAAEQTPPREILNTDPTTISAFGAAMIPVLFAYGGWQTVCFIGGEVKEPNKNLPRGLLFGVMGVIILYLLVNFVCVNVLGPKALAATSTPASQVMRIALGEKGANFIAIGITISTLGFLSQSILTAPRVYFAMAADRLFFKNVAWVHQRTHVPVVAIALQGTLAMLIAVSGRYDQILNYVVSIDFIFFGLTAVCIFVFRRRAKEIVSFRMPGHPITTLFFIATCWLVVMNTIVKYPSNTIISLVIMLAGIPVYFFWRWRNRV